MVFIAQAEEWLDLYYERCSALDDAVAADPSYASQSRAAERIRLRHEYGRVYIESADVEPEN